MTEMTVWRALPAALASSLLVLALALSLRESILGRHWPGWDDFWVVLAFGLGVPVVVAAALRWSIRDVASVTGLVWGWGAALLVVWLLLG